MTQTQQIWLTHEAYERLKAELAELLRQRAERPMPAGHPEDDSRDQNLPDGVFADHRERELRIRKLQEILRNPIVGHEPPDDGVAEPGMVVTVRYADDPETETFLLAERAPDAYPGMEICSPDSPLGSALTGAREGEERQYQLPNGEMMTVTLVRAVPYRGQPQ